MGDVNASPGGFIRREMHSIQMTVFWTQRGFMNFGEPDNKNPIDNDVVQIWGADDAGALIDQMTRVLRRRVLLSGLRKPGV